ncbi:hypothetical protein IFT64_16155 [Oxalobacteraceae sp. CFBP 8753]|nr:hypothetical protein [Oxalobacteraceae sp. CFBP 8753]
MTAITKTNAPFIENNAAIAKLIQPNKWNVIEFNEIAQANSVALSKSIHIDTAARADSNTFIESNSNIKAAQQSEEQPQPKNQTNIVQSAVSTFTRPVFDKEKILPIFREKLNKIYNSGTNLNETENKYHGKIQEKAVNGLAEILGVRRTYFDDTTPEVSSILLDELYEQCKANGLKGRNKQTTEFHLLSKLFRQSDRRQASADAKVLIRAHNEDQTEKTFADWVRKLGGLNKIKTEIDSFECKQKQADAEQRRTQNKHKGNLKTLFDVSLAASWTPLTSFRFEDSPGELKELIPSDGTWLPIAIARRNGKVTFYIPQKDSCPTELYPDLVEDTAVVNSAVTSKPNDSE